MGNKSLPRSSRPGISEQIEPLERRRMFAATPVFAHSVFKMPVEIITDTTDVLGDTAVFAGGEIKNANGQWTATNDVYFFDAARRKWSLRHMPAVISQRTEVVVGDQMVFAGGIGSRGVTDEVDIYTAKTHQWSTAKLSAARYAMGVTTVGNLSLFAGGSLRGGKSSGMIDINNARTGQWSTAALPSPRRGVAAVSVGRLAIFAGGDRIGSDVSDEVDILDTKTGVWSTAHLSSPGYCIAASAGHYALFEHLQNSSILSGPDDVDVYNASNNTWSTMAIPDDSYDVQTVGKYVIFADGIEPGNGDLGVNSHNVHIFNSATGQWSTTQVQGGTSDMAITSLADRYILFAGGTDDNENETSAAYVLDAETDRWTVTHALSSAREASDYFTIANTAYVAGGRLDVYGNQNTAAVDAYTLES